MPRKKKTDNKAQAPQATPPPTPARAIADLKPREIFVSQGIRYRLEGFDDEGARVTRLAVQRYEVATGKFKEMDIGVETLHLPSDTQI